MNGLWFVAVVTYLECPVSESNQRVLRTGLFQLRRVVVPQKFIQRPQQQVVVNYNEPVLTVVCYDKRQQKAVARKEIAKRQQLRDESESDSSSGSEVQCNITSSDEYPVRTTREKSKAQEAAAATTSLPKSDEGSTEADSDGDNPPTDTLGKGNDDADKLGEDDTNAEDSSDKDSVVEESNEQEEDSGITPEARSKRWFLQGSRDVYYAGLNLNEKGNPIRSIQEEPKIQINALNEVTELKRIFEGYNMYWMEKTPGKYSMEMVHEFYANYYCTLEKKASSKTALRKSQC
ncbi:hypothetical protein HAX54_017366 [Datura stramonium]|uniref:Uncharacterized protein n=1 Tax=Datura stramonium TaxID=4076 RepID=A0ABS8S0Q2_DATST|nr:hypothetical protein [Datura stramonium]